MIRVEITRIDREQYTATENFQTKKTPSGYKRSSYGGGEELAYEEEWTPREVSKIRETTRTLLKQELDEVDIPRVIAAINGL